jgi:aarF domain-containing kinase
MTAQDLSAAPVANDQNAERELNTYERLARSVKFYSNALPVFFAYKALEAQLDFNKEYLGETLTEEQRNERFNILHEWGSTTLRDITISLKGFYVKTGQVISTRVDIFPVQYTSKLAVLQDELDPLPGSVVKEVVRRELLNDAELSDLFLEFDDEPLGAASIAQVHRARLLDGRVVAVKVQRPGVEAKLLGDIENLKQFAKLVGDSLPIDYYKIFCELERTLRYELDFLHEAQSTMKVATAIAHGPRNNAKKKVPVTVPLPISGLVSRRVMVMEFIDGRPLSSIAKEILETQQREKEEKERGTVLTPLSAEERQEKDGKKIFFANKLLSSLTDAYSSMIFGSGIIHGDPHPGNIFVLEGAQICLLDCGQVKELTTPQRLGLARLIVSVNKWESVNKKYTELKKSGDTEAAIVSAKAAVDEMTTSLASQVRSFGVTFKAGAGDEAAAAIAVLLFGNSATELPGGYVGAELDSRSPIVQVLEFPQEFVLLGRATVMIKGIAKRLEMEWSLSDRWGAVAQEAIDAVGEEQLPIWSVLRPRVSSKNDVASPDSRVIASRERPRFRDVLQAVANTGSILVHYLGTKLTRVVGRLPKGFREWAAKQFLRLCRTQ